MTHKGKDSDIGWMYHTPKKREENKEPVDVPPQSQIPGLSDLPMGDDPEQQRKNWFKDTDTPYIRLCKEGGRQNLLAFKEFKPKTKEPKGYARCEWFYNEDLKQQEEEAKDSTPYVPRLPEYMVHDEYRPYGDAPEAKAHDDKYSPRQAPYAFEKGSVFNKERGRKASDKTVKVPEEKKVGYGVREQKQNRKATKVPQKTIATKSRESPSKTNKSTKSFKAS